MKLLSISEVARKFRTSEKTIRRFPEQFPGRLILGKMYRWDEEILDAHFKELAKQPIKKQVSQGESSRHNLR